MHIPTLSERRDHELTAILYDATDGGRVGGNPLEALTSTGLNFEDAQRWVLDARARDLLTLDDGIAPEAQLTAAARDQVEHARQRASDRSARRRLAMARLLAWADSGGQNIATFEASDHAWEDGARFTFAESVEAAERLRDAGLVDAKLHTAWGGDVVRADITRISPAGRECLEDYDGDVSAYQAAAVARTHVGAQHITISNVTGPVTVGGHGSTNSSAWAFDPELVRALAETLTNERDALGLTAEDAADLDDHVLALTEAADPSRVQRAVRWAANLGKVSAEKAITSYVEYKSKQILGG